MRSASIGKSERRRQTRGGLPSTTLSQGNAIYRPTSLEERSKKSPSSYAPSVLYDHAAYAPPPPPPLATSATTNFSTRLQPSGPSEAPSVVVGAGGGGRTTTNANKNNQSPFDKLLEGKFKQLPMVTFLATLLSLGLYTLVAVLLWFMSCPWDKNQIGHLFAFCLYAILASLLILIINCMYSRYRFNLLSLTASLLYSGSATLVAYKLILALFEGLCQPQGTPSGSFLTVGHAGNWLIWFSGVAAVGLQLVAHYYYG